MCVFFYKVISFNLAIISDNRSHREHEEKWFYQNEKRSLCVQQDPKSQRFYGINVDGGNRRHAQQTG